MTLPVDMSDGNGPAGVRRMQRHEICRKLLLFSMLLDVPTNPGPLGLDLHLNQTFLSILHTSTLSSSFSPGCFLPVFLILFPLNISAS